MWCFITPNATMDDEEFVLWLIDIIASEYVCLRSYWTCECAGYLSISSADVNPLNVLHVQTLHSNNKTIFHVLFW